MIGLYVIVTAMIFFMAGIVVGWCLHGAHVDFIKRVTDAVLTEYKNFDKSKDKETP